MVRFQFLFGVSFIQCCCREEDEEPDLPISIDEVPRLPNEQVNYFKRQARQGKSEETTISQIILVQRQEDQNVPKLQLEVIEGEEMGQRYEAEANNEYYFKFGDRDSETVMQQLDEKDYYSSIEAEQSEDTFIKLGVKYNSDTQIFSLIDLGSTSGAFKRILQPTALQQGNIISFGDSHMVILRQSDENNPDIVLNFIEGPKLEEKFQFSPEDSPIMIGRMVDCRIRFYSEIYSRYQCSVIYENGVWYAKDGHQSPSTNGVWLYLEKFTDVEEDDQIKAGKTILRITSS